ncbi:MAG TPA: amidohydrolase family protein [Candidatus Limnocylindria bacterium]
MAGLLFRGAALADGRSAALERGVSLLISDGKIAYLGPRDGEPDPGEAQIVDASGATIVPGLVDCHAHFTGLGGAHWIDRFGDPEDELLGRGPRAADALVRMGILAARDVGAPRRLNLRIRDAVRGGRLAPTIVAAGTWIARRDKFPPFVVFVDSPEQLLQAALAELDAGADLVKCAVDTGRTGDEVTFSVDELRPMVEAVHARDRKVAAHAQGKGAAIAAAAGVDSIEHGFGVDAGVAGTMAGHTALVPTLSVLASLVGFAATDGGRFADARPTSEALLERALDAVRAAHAAGVRIATGSDFGGGSVRPGHLAWEVELLVRAGLAPHEALGSATFVGGELLGLPDAGRLRVGGPADCALVHGDPLSDPAALWRVWLVVHDGVVV